MSSSAQLLGVPEPSPPKNFTYVTLLRDPASSPCPLAPARTPTLTLALGL